MLHHVFYLGIAKLAAILALRSSVLQIWSLLVPQSVRRTRRAQSSCASGQTLKVIYIRFQFLFSSFTPWGDNSSSASSQ